jgi:hypothetical protein
LLVGRCDCGNVIAPKWFINASDIAKTSNNKRPATQPANQTNRQHPREQLPTSNFQLEIETTTFFLQTSNDPADSFVLLARS